MYGKLINGVMRYAPVSGKLGDTIYKPTIPLSALVENGYKEVVFVDQPVEVVYDHHWVAGWAETEYSIVQTWNSVEDDTTQQQRRALAYSTRKIITYGNGLYTVDEARQICSEYQYDGTERATEIIAELSQKIAQAKQAIRELYPDEGV